MAKINKFEQARIDGFEYFVRLYQKQDIRIPEIDEEIKRRNLTGKPIGLDKDMEQEYCKNVFRLAVDTTTILVQEVLHIKYGFGRKRLNQFKEWFNSEADCVTSDSVTWGDIRKALEEETGIETEIQWFGQKIENPVSEGFE